MGTPGTDPPRATGSGCRPLSSPLAPLQVLRSALGAGQAWEEDAASFYLDSGDGKAATVIYDYKNVGEGLGGTRGGGDGWS